ncbi:RNA polymerase sigma factor [Sphingomonas crusticola]|uniref:RNA polymerase sigma factor n=1 Tax=Sphingomonas crusticola TaxID=1697973 RepID=UPI000E27DB14|nr:sigma-70 family RNA polymerase sigma factor [Sphingomonas crusticola]
MKEDDRRRKLVVWVAQKVMPHEPAVRAWLARSMVAREDIDDLIQEAYCRIAALDSVTHVERPDAFFFQIVRNLLINQIRHARVVRIDAVTEVEFHELHDDAPSPEQLAGDRREWTRVRRLLDRLPGRCQQIFEMRKLEGRSQREIAAALGVSENVVENESSNGLRMLLDALRQEGEQVAGEYQARRARRVHHP